MRKVILVIGMAVGAVVLTVPASGRDRSRLKAVEQELAALVADGNTVLAANGHDVNDPRFRAVTAESAPRFAEWRALHRRHPEWAGK